ncbi:MAG: uracil-DNA glycosylase [Gammaproteobacteria bacterium]|jgi:DNA polymerase|nr:uracil-DNA glycosylase [Chromatiales bacterium]MDP6675587.1 uracil-DNA glycosylase [Gammaproteobacteria bacterium]
MPEFMGAEQRRILHALDIDVWLPRHVVADAATEAGGSEVSPTADKDWPTLESAVSVCTQCLLHQTRKQTVFGDGDRGARWMIVGEAPGADEDRQGKPFVGKAGQMLNEMLRAVGLNRERVFIANILKCRPPNNRDPRVDEVASCMDFLRRQVALVQPQLIVAVGRIAAQHLLNEDKPVGQLRGRVHSFAGPEQSTPVVVTYHPAYLLRSPGQKRKAWEDLCLARSVCEVSGA